MKLPIKKKFFDQIKSGEKVFEYRDAHITFVCEETGETLTKPVFSVNVVSKAGLTCVSEKDKADLFDDEMLIEFLLEWKKEGDDGCTNIGKNKD